MGEVCRPFESVCPKIHSHGDLSRSGSTFGQKMHCVAGIVKCMLRLESAFQEACLECIRTPGCLPQSVIRSLQACNIVEPDGSYVPIRHLLKHRKVIVNRGDVCRGLIQIFVSLHAASGTLRDHIKSRHQDGVAVLLRVASPA